MKEIDINIGKEINKYKKETIKEAKSNKIPFFTKEQKDLLKQFLGIKKQKEIEDSFDANNSQEDIISLVLQKEEPTIGDECEEEPMIDDQCGYHVLELEFCWAWGQQPCVDSE